MEYGNNPYNGTTKSGTGYNSGYKKSAYNAGASKKISLKEKLRPIGWTLLGIIIGFAGCIILQYFA